ncbi:MAG: hypothetical protein HBSAPP03_10640 [Phycisphaerae bacterium]|nr:MAG: hypothetical protein HBSAPP03_10640 [Phycisphaerae bacterium]
MPSCGLVFVLEPSVGGSFIGLAESGVLVIGKGVAGVIGLIGLRARRRQG